MSLKTIFQYLIILILTMTGSAAMSFTRYTKPVPKGLIVCETRAQLNEVSLEFPDGNLWGEDGGYYLKDGDDNRVAVAADSLCPELDRVVAEVEALDTKEALEGIAEETSESTMEKREKNECSHPRCSNPSTCRTYTGCYSCLQRGRCV